VPIIIFEWTGTRVMMGKVKEKFHNLYFSPYIVRIITLMWMIRAERECIRRNEMVIKNFVRELSVKEFT